MSFYGIDWLILLIMVFHLWLIGNKDRQGFLLGALAACGGVMLGVMIDSVPQILCSLLVIVMQMRAYFLWKNS